MSKKQLDLRVDSNERIHPLYSLIKLSPVEGSLPHMLPGQFVQVKVPGAEHTFLRRPISVNNVLDGQLWLLVRRAGEGTAKLMSLPVGTVVNVLAPLGNSFELPETTSQRALLIGGGVGIAPMLYLGREMAFRGHKPAFLIGARSKDDILEADLLNRYGDVHISTDDGSAGEHGLVTTNSVLDNDWDVIYCCGPAPMMKAVAAIARKRNIKCFVSLENMMACGLGACLCCVEKTVRGNVCVCTEGPVFNINELTWQD